MSDVCSFRYVHLLDNFLRPWIHNPTQLFGAYLQPGMRVLDIGCGGGFAAIGMARLVGTAGRVVAADVQLKMLSYVNSRARKAGLDDVIKTHLCDPNDMNVTGTFDFVNAFYMAHEVPNGESLLNQVHSCLKKNGRFFIVEPRYHVSRKQFDSFLEMAGQCQFIVETAPKVRFSMAALLQAI